MNQTAVTTIEKLIPELSLQEQLWIFERLAQQLRYTMQQAGQPQDLYGVWRNFVPKEFELDRALQEIRQGWQDE